MYEDGDGVEQSNEIAVYWFRKAAVLGDAPCQFCLGMHLKKKAGLGCEESLEGAWRFLTLAARQNHPRALYNLGVMHEHGLSAFPAGRRHKRDYAKARELYAAAAGLGHTKVPLGLLFVCCV
jgi:TPR repeat protein